MLLFFFFKNPNFWSWNPPTPRCWNVGHLEMICTILKIFYPLVNYYKIAMENHWLHRLIMVNQRTKWAIFYSYVKWQEGIIFSMFFHGSTGASGASSSKDGSERSAMPTRTVSWCTLVFLDPGVCKTTMEISWTMGISLYIPKLMRIFGNLMGCIMGLVTINNGDPIKNGDLDNKNRNIIGIRQP